MATPAAILSILVKTDGAKLATTQLTQLDAAAKKTGDTAEGVSKKHKKAFDGIQKWSGIATVAVGAVGAGAVKMAADFESSMNTLQAVSGATTSQMTAMRKEAIKLGADIRLPATSAKDAGEAMTEMVKAGVSVKDTMGGVRDVLVLSAAAQVSNARAAEIASNAMNAFKLKGKDVKLITDELANTANASSVEINDVADSFKMAAAVFSGFQAPTIGAKKAMTELNVAIGLLGNAGIKGSDAGTSLKQMLLQLTGPSNRAKGAMEALYLAAQGATLGQKDLTNVIQGGTKDRDKALNTIVKHNKALADGGDIAYTAAGKMRSLKDIIALVSAGTKNMTDVEKNAYITQIFGADATRSVIALMNAGPAAFDKMTASVTKQGAAQALADAKMKGLKGSIEAAKSAVETLGITFGTVLLPALTQAVRGITALAAPLGENKTLTMALVGTLGALAATIWTVVTAAKAYFAIQTLIESGALVAVAPFLAVAAAIVAVGAGFIYAYKNSETFRASVQTVLTWLQGAGTAALNWLTAAFQNTVATITSVTNTVVGEVQQWDTLFSAIGRGVQIMVSVVRVQMDALKLIWKVGMVALMPIVVTVWTGIKDIFSGAFTILKGIVTGGLEVLRGIVKIIGGLFKGDFGQVWDGIKTIFSGGIKALKGILEGAWEILKAPVDSITAGIENVFSKSWDRIKGVFRTGVNAVIDFLNLLIKAINAIPGIPDIKPIANIGNGGGGGGGSNIPVNKKARGGAFARTGGLVNQPITLMGEEAPRHPEFVIPTNPAYRNRAKGLLGQAAQALGMAKGGMYSQGEIMDLWTGQHGASGRRLIASAIAMAESGGDANASSANPAGGVNRGLYQIWSGNPGSTFDPAGNTRTAIMMSSDGTDWGQWEAFTNGSYMRFMGKGRGAGLPGGLPSIGDVLGKFPSPSDLPPLMQGVGKYVIGKATAYVKKAIGGLFTEGGGTGLSVGPAGVGSFMGIPMANWVIGALKHAQSKGVNVRPTSGYRPGFDPHTATGKSEHQGTQYPHGAVDFGGYHDAAALAMKMAVVGATSDYKYPLLPPAGFVDDGHASGTGHKRGGVFSYLGSFARGGVTGSEGFAHLHKNEAVIPLAGGGVNVQRGSRIGSTAKQTATWMLAGGQAAEAWARSAAAQAQLTATMSDDIAAAKALVEAMQQQYDAIKVLKANDPGALADAANGLYNAISGLNQLTASTTAATADATDATDANTAAQDEANQLQAEANAIAARMADLIAQQNANQLKIIALTQQGPEILAAVVAAVNGNLGGKVGLGFQTPSFPGGMASYR